MSSIKNEKAETAEEKIAREFGVAIAAKGIEKAYNKFKNSLTTREKDVITRYYGIDKQVRHTLAEIGEIYSVTRERIRQIKLGALIKLKIKDE